MIISQLTLPPACPKQVSTDLVRAPRTERPRYRTHWDEAGIVSYKNLVSSQLQQVRQAWLDPESKVLTSVLLQATNHVLSSAACTTNQSTLLDAKQSIKCIKIPAKIRAARRKLLQKQKIARCHPSRIADEKLKIGRKLYRQTVRNIRLSQSLRRDKLLDTILSKNPSKIHTFLRSSKQTRSSTIARLSVGKKLYYSNMVGDGFYDSMSSLKYCDVQSLTDDPALSNHFLNFDNILKICKQNPNIPLIDNAVAMKLLKRLKTHVVDIFGITAAHYINAGDEGLAHFKTLINCVLSDVNNATTEELNLVLGLILFKGHGKDKTSDRSYRTISTCPLLSKAIDLYLRDLYQESWDACTAPTQYQTTDSSHELASLLVTEVAQYSLNISDKPVFLLVLDAQSAFDRCLRQILCTELFKTGMTGSALLLVNNRLQSRSTVYQWDGEMLGPAQDITGFEQGGINSGDFYKLYNNSQLRTAQSSCLGVDIKSSVVSAIGQADDVVLAASSVDCLRLLALLTESYCASYRVKLVSSKTKLLPLYRPKHLHLVEYAKLTNPVTIDDSPVKFVDEVEHVGVIRSTRGNMPHILHRIASHKNDLNAICSSGMSRGHRGNPAASLRVHQLHATPVLLSGVASLVLTKAETNVLTSHYKSTLQNLQRLHPNTPRAVVYFLSGSLPCEALLHCRQLGLFSMICRLQEDPLHIHAKFILSSAPPSAKSWFQQILHLTIQYGLPNPSFLLANPPPKGAFKNIVKKQITQYWKALLIEETKPLQSLKYFKPELYSLTKAHYIWSSAASNPFETSKSTVLACMASGRFRTEYLCRHWSTNKAGYCRAPSCYQTLGTLEHLLVVCPALDIVRQRLYNMWLEKSVMFPALHSTIKEVLTCDDSTKVQFILEPLYFSEISHLYNCHGQHFIQQLAYLTRTFAFYINKEYKKIVKMTETSPPLNYRAAMTNISSVTNTSHVSVAVSCASSAQPLQLSAPVEPYSGVCMAVAVGTEVATLPVQGTAYISDINFTSPDSHVHVPLYDVPQHGGLVGPGYVGNHVLRSGHDKDCSDYQPLTWVAGLPGDYINRSESFVQHHCKQSHGLRLGPAECPCGWLGCLGCNPWDPLDHHTHHHQGFDTQ